MITNYMLILFGVSIVFYLIGYQPMMLQILGENVGTNEPIAQDVLNKLFSIFTNEIFLSVLAVTAVSSFLLGGSNYSVAFIFPILLFSIFANIFVLPSSYLFDPTLPPLLRTFIGIFFNLFLMLAIINFVRGGEM